MLVTDAALGTGTVKNVCTAPSDQLNTNAKTCNTFASLLLVILATPYSLDGNARIGYDSLIFPSSQVLNFLHRPAAEMRHQWTREN
jgi:hypothetical protein